MAPHNGDLHFGSDFAARKTDNNSGTVQVMRVMSTEHLDESEGGLSIGHVVSAGWRHITDISDSGLILQHLRSTITRERFELHE